MSIGPPLPRRVGTRPTTTDRTPHRQVDQQPTDPTVVDRLVERVTGRWPGVHEEASGISVPGARALVVDAGVPTGPPEAFVTGREFAHFHPAPDRSLHLALPPAAARHAVDAGWAEPHVAVATGQVPGTVVLVYAPRTAEEAEVALFLLDQSFRFATAAPSDTADQEDA